MAVWNGFGRVVPSDKGQPPGVPRSRVDDWYRQWPQLDREVAHMVDYLHKEAMNRLPSPQTQQGKG